VSTRRHLAYRHRLYLAAALVVVAVGLSTLGSATPHAAYTSAHAATLTASHHVDAGVLARTLRHPVPGTSAVHVRTALTTTARARPSVALARVSHRHTPLYTLLRVYRL
jgi:hypothetical protein